MTLQVSTTPCALTIVSFRLFGEFRLVHVFLSFGHGEGCVVVVFQLLMVRRRANGDGLSSDNDSTLVDAHRKTDTGRDSTAADAQEIVGGTTTANDRNACAISLCHCVEHDGQYDTVL